MVKTLHYVRRDYTVTRGVVMVIPLQTHTVYGNFQPDFLVTTIFEAQENNLLAHHEKSRDFRQRFLCCFRYETQIRLASQRRRHEGRRKSRQGLRDSEVRPPRLGTARQVRDHITKRIDRPREQQSMLQPVRQSELRTRF